MSHRPTVGWQGTEITVWFRLRQVTDVQVLEDRLVRGEQVHLKESNIITVNDSLSESGDV